MPEPISITSARRLHPFLEEALSCHFNGCVANGWVCPYPQQIDRRRLTYSHEDFDALLEIAFHVTADTQEKLHIQKCNQIAALMALSHLVEMGEREPLYSNPLFLVPEQIGKFITLMGCKTLLSLEAMSRAFQVLELIAEKHPSRLQFEVVEALRNSPLQLQGWEQRLQSVMDKVAYSMMPRSAMQ